MISVGELVEPSTTFCRLLLVTAVSSQDLEMELDIFSPLIREGSARVNEKEGKFRDNSYVTQGPEERRKSMNSCKAKI
ncbi:MAG: hypothetical protein ABFD50_18370 [Smithella sp.]